MRALRADDTGFDTIDVDVFVLNQHRFTRILSHNSTRTDASQLLRIIRSAPSVEDITFRKSEDSVSFLGPEFRRGFFSHVFSFHPSRVNRLFKKSDF